jgi:hypothetical protein
MKRLKQMLPAIMFFSCFLFLLGTTSSQDITKNENTSRELGYAGYSNEPMSGYWKLNNSMTEIANLEKHTQWSTETGTLTAVTSWDDNHNIEHTISASFRWDNPPDKMTPGGDVKIKGTFVNNEYSSIGRVLYGLLVSIGNSGTKFFNVKTDATQVLQINKDYRQHNSEVKDGWFNAPKHYTGESTWIQIMVDCYIGQDHYVTTYVYTWVESTPL